MQPNPMADTSRLLLPSFRFCTLIPPMARRHRSVRSPRISEKHGENGGYDQVITHPRRNHPAVNIAQPDAHVLTGTDVLLVLTSRFLVALRRARIPSYRAMGLRTCASRRVVPASSWTGHLLLPCPTAPRFYQAR